MNNEQSTQQQLHWFSVSHVSEAAQAEIEEKGGQVLHISSMPAVALVGLAHNDNEQVECSSAGDDIELHVASTGLSLIWASTLPNTYVPYVSVLKSEIVTPEEYHQALAVKYAAMTHDSADDVLGDLDEHPF